MEKNKNKGVWRALVLAGAVSISGVGVSDAAILIEIIGGEDSVVTTYSGSIQLGGLDYLRTDNESNTIMVPNLPFIEFGGITDSVDFYTLNGTMTRDDGAFGPSSDFSATEVSGDHFTFQGGAYDVRVPEGYTSGTFISGSATYGSETITSMGLNVGTYVYEWGVGSDANSITIVISDTVPEVSSSLLFLGGIAVVALRRKRS